MNRPALHERALEQALEAMRTGQALRDHVLFSFLCVRVRLREPDSLAGQAALQVAVFDLLTSTILDRLARIRALSSLPPPDPIGVDPGVAADFSLSNQELEAWSALYARYVCVDRALSIGDLEALTGVPERTLRRRIDRGIRRLTFQLVRIEQAARRQERHLRLRLALPQTQPPVLVGVDALLLMVVHLVENADAPRHVLLHGPPGSGKTALALAAAHRLVNKHSLDDVLWLALAGRSMSPEAVLNEIAVRLGLVGDDHTAPAQAVRAYLLLHRVLLILDGAEGLVEISESLLAALSSAQVLITSRTELPPEVWCAQVTLPELTREQALQWVESAAQTVREQDRLIDRFEAVWPLTGGNPLALKVALSLAQHVPSVSLRAVSQSLHPLGTVLNTIWEGLSFAERQLWIASCLFHPMGLPCELCGVLLDLAPDQVISALATLSRMSLLDPVTDSLGTVVYRLPSALASYLASIVRDDGDLSESCSSRQLAGDILRRCACYLVDHPDALLALNIVQVAHQLSFPDSDRWFLMSELAPQITEARLWQTWTDELRALAANDLSGPQQTWRDHHLGVALRWIGQFAEARALFESVLFRTSPPETQHTAALMELSVIHRYQGNWDESFRLARSAFQKLMFSEDDDGIRRCIHEIAQIAVDVQDPARALSWLRRLEVWDARAWGSASQAYTIMGQHDDAIAAAHHALDLLPQQHPHRGRGMIGVANAYAADRRLQPAVDYLIAALDQLDQWRDVIGYARGTNNLAAVLLHQPIEERVWSNTRLRQLLEQALAVLQQCGDELGCVVTQRNLARLLSETAW